MIELEVLLQGTRWQHHKRGSIYTVLHVGTFQHAAPELDATLVVVYRDDRSGRVYVRRLMEFTDGRFSPLGVTDGSC